MSLNLSSLVTLPHLKMTPLGGVEILTKIIKACWIKNYRSAQTNVRSLLKWIFVRRLTLRVATRQRGPFPNARQVCLPSVPRLNEQVCPKVTLDLVRDIDFDDGAAAAHVNTAGTVFVPGTRNLERPQMLSDIMSAAVEMEAQTKLAPDPVSMPSVPKPHTAHSREQSRSPRRHADEESFGLTSVHLSHQFGFRDSTLWCWRCGGWSAGSRRASRLQGPCGAPTKNGADVVYRVSGGFPAKARIWRSDDVSGAPERIPIIKNPYSNRYRPQVLPQDDSPA